MLISLNWIREFVDLPADLDAKALAEKFTRTTAEVDDVRPIHVAADGLIAAKVCSQSVLDDGKRKLSRVTLEGSGGAKFESVTAAPNVAAGDVLVYAPPGASVAARGRVGSTQVAGCPSEGMILPGEDLGLALAVQEAILLPPRVAPGTPLLSAPFDDWIIEVDNKSLTHRPDLWGHYGIAREIAAILKKDLKPYPVEAVRDWENAGLPTIPIDIREPDACRRYSGILLDGVTAQPAPLWMQLRLGHVGLRPINGLVDLTNYIMLELSQPMHAFDAAQVSRIEVAFGEAGDTFMTLDGVERRLPPRALMIQSAGKNVALAGIMGGRQTEVTPQTRTLLLESANFDAATIRRCASALGLRTDASARFEKALDPINTVAAIQRFIGLAKAEYPALKLASRVSDSFAKPFPTLQIAVDPRRAARVIGRRVDREEIREILEAIDFGCEDDGEGLRVEPPSFRATRDVTIEEDVIEEVARFVGYGHIAAELPRVSVRRFEPNALHDFEQQTLAWFSRNEALHEIHGYIWSDAARLQRLGIPTGPRIELRNAMGEGLHPLRRELTPNLLDALTLNRFHFPQVRLMELGSVFEPAPPQDAEFRHVGLLIARRQKQAEEALLSELKGAIERWAWSLLTRPVAYATCTVEPPVWSEPHRTADVRVGDLTVGRIGIIPLAMRRKLDEHLAAWSAAWAELRINALAELGPLIEKLGRIPPFPLVEMDFTFLTRRGRRYETAASELASFSHALLKRLTYVTSFEGESVGPDHRSLTVRALVGDAQRTLAEADLESFRQAFAAHLRRCGYEMRM
ncbi:MAG: phenylalanine--tRNA ligase subunit beta [Phycisphaerales bacterium]|nr:phenylalanine--tRNA ligase subunit beta [Phycisphaerales bacterium]